jgi:hypothetical protein
MPLGPIQRQRSGAWFGTRTHTHHGNLYPKAGCTRLLYPHHHHTPPNHPEPPPPRLPDSNLLFGLPVVMDTDSEAIKEGDNVRGGWAGGSGCRLHSLFCRARLACL